MRLRGLRFSDHDNKMALKCGEIRVQDWCIRTLEKAGTPFLTGMQIFHNYVRPHDAVNGKTAAEVSGIKVEGDNRWLTLIQNASKNTAGENAS